MRRPGLPVVSGISIAIALGAAVTAAAEQGTDLPALAASLDLSVPGARKWLARLGAMRVGPTRERLLALSPAGEVLMARDGDGSSVRVDAEMDRLLRQPETRIVLVHNHPANAGLSGADLAQLSKPGVTAIVAVAHDGSVFIASAGPHLDRESFHDRQYGVAKAAVLRRLGAVWPSARLPAEIRDKHVAHLVTAVLARAGIVRYWFELRGSNRRSYASGRFFFSRVLLARDTRSRND